MTRQYLTDEYTRELVKSHRDLCRAGGVCINGPRPGNRSRKGVAHGVVVSGGKCQRCLELHRRSA